MSKSIAAVLRDAALGPAPNEQQYLASWIFDVQKNEVIACHAYDFAFDFVDKHPIRYMLEEMTDAECRMFLLFCSYAAEDEE